MGGFLKCKKNSSRGRSGLLKILAERKQWELEEQKLAEIEKYFHTIRVKANDEDVLTLSGNEQKNGATLVIANRMKNDESQQWIYDMSTGKIKLEANPKFVVTLFLGSVVLWEDKNWPWQKWDFKDNKFTSKDSSKSQPTGCVSKRAAATPRPRRYSAETSRGVDTAVSVEAGVLGTA